MTDLKSRADELIKEALVAWREGEVAETRRALTRFVHALCGAADKLGKSRTWAQHHSSCAMIQVFGKCDCGLSEFRPELDSALAALEKGEKV